MKQVLASMRKELRQLTQRSSNLPVTTRMSERACDICES
jgi:hypothetical protein